MYNANWFSEEFLPSLYEYYTKMKSESDSENRPVFISEKQFNIIARNCDQRSDGVYQSEYDGLTFLCSDGVSRKGSKFFTINFVDNFIEKYREIGSKILERLIEIRDNGIENLNEYAQTYYNTVMELLHITELDMQYLDYDEFKSQVDHAKELNTYYVSLLTAIGKFIE